MNIFNRAKLDLMLVEAKYKEGLITAEEAVSQALELTVNLCKQLGLLEDDGK